LSVASLYHPADRFKYVVDPTPLIRFASGLNDAPEILVKRDNGWKQILFEDGKETEFPAFEQLCSLLSPQDDESKKRAKQAIDALLSGTSRPLAPALISMDDSLVVIGLDRQLRWITRALNAWREVSLSPDSKRIAYIDSNDLYVMHLESGQVTRITDDGSATKLNGLLDWVYQEEIYGRGNFRGYWWREDSSAIVFLKLDTTAVAEFVVTESKEPQGRTVVERYPKAGEAIPQAELWCVQLNGSIEDTNVSLKQLLRDQFPQDTLITRVGWHKQTGDVIVQSSNRLQNEVIVHVVDIYNPVDPTVIVKEQCDKWLEVQELPKILASGDYLRLSDLPEGRRRLWRISADGSHRTPITPADFDVRELLFVDRNDNYVLLTGDQLRGTVGQQLYRADLKGAASLERLTDASAWHNVSISDDGEWMIDRASSLATPTTTSLRSLVNREKQSILLHREQLKLEGEPIEATWHSIKADGDVSLPAYVIRPADNGDVDARYPVLIEVYGGPLAPSVRDTWSSGRYLFHQMLAREGIGVMVVDNRSSGGRGLFDSWSIHRRMGDVETKDLVTAAEWLGRQDWVDAKRLALRGWSFGGFLTLHAMTHSDKFAAGVAGGSVTDWRNYDAVYTERYMGLPSENRTGYDETSPKLAASKMHGRVLMLHGEVDDNVHLANTLQMAGNLQRAGKLFDLMVYPGAAHAVHSPDQNFHLMNLTMEFLRRELRPTTAVQETSSTVSP